MVHLFLSNSNFIFFFKEFFYYLIQVKEMLSKLVDVNVSSSLASSSL